MHTIRLRHPWQCEPDGDVVVWSRKFNWPSELMPGERVHLVVEPVAVGTVLRLNGTVLAGENAGRIDITSQIATHNLLAITSAGAPPDDSQKCPFEVRLEIAVE